MASHRELHFTEAESLEIASKIKQIMAEKGISRKSLVRNDLSESTINKALAGSFSAYTLIKIESALNGIVPGCISVKRSHGIVTGEEEENWKDLGHYSEEMTELMQGRYVMTRPCFKSANTLVAYFLDLTWSEDEECLVFQEHGRPDAKTNQR